MNRKQANLEILAVLVKLVEAYPDSRFVQILFNADVLITSGVGADGLPQVLNEFYLESTATLDRVKSSYIFKLEES
jgi:hypothetical protein